MTEGSGARPRASSAGRLDRWREARRGPRGVSFTLLALGLGLAAPIVGFSFVLPQTASRLARPTATLIERFPPWAAIADLPWPVPSGTLALAGTVVGLVVLAFVAYGVAVFVAWRLPATRRLVASVVVVAIVLDGIVALALPTYDTDIFNYIVGGRVGAVHGANPHTVPPDAFPTDPVYPYAGRTYTSIAGDNKLPAWTALNTVLATLGSGLDVVGQLFLYRAAFLAANVLTLVLVGFVAGHLAPQLTLTALVLYGWNPIVLLYGQSKVDTLMACLAIAAAAVLVRVGRVDRPRAGTAVALLGLSALIKIITLPTLALTVLVRWRTAGRAVLLDLALLAALGVLAYLPYWSGPETLIAHLGLVASAGSSSTGVIRWALFVGFGALLAVLAWRQSGEAGPLVRSWGIAALAFGALLTRIGLAWYLISPIALVAAFPSRGTAIVAIGVSFSSLMFDAWERLPLPDLPGPSSILYLVPVAIAAALAFEVGRRRRRHAAVPSDALGPDG